MDDAQPDTQPDGAEVERGEVERIALHRRIAVITPDSVAIKQPRGGLVGPLVQALIAGGSVFLIATYMDRLPIWLLLVLLVLLLIFGPAAVLGLVYNVVGSAFIMERKKQSARWQQGFLGLGLGTHELVPFWRISEIRVRTDYDDELAGGDLQDVVEWAIELVKDNGRVLQVGTVVAARPLAQEATERANRVAEALAEMAGAAAALAAVPLAEEEPAAEDMPAPPARRFRRIDGPHAEDRPT
ncbi:MAG: hypothetical protein GEU80_03400 [Dehalococcoidia bacterium]|nr:hypothetical protein [Dehalococcoidia bacterium]